MRFVGFALCLSFAVAAPAVWERVRISGDSGERVVEGRVVVEAQDGSLLVEHADQRLEVVPGAEVQSREAVPTTPEPLTPRAVGDAVLRLRERVVAGDAPGITRQSELFTDPIGHAKAPVMALATYCNFACLYGRSPVGLDDGDRELDRTHPKLRSVLQEIAWDAVTSHPLSGVTKDGLVRSDVPADAAGEPAAK